MTNDSRPVLPYNFLLVLLVISVCTNVLLLSKSYWPGWWNGLNVGMKAVPEVQATDHIRGESDAKYTIIEYSDFQCPYCREFHQQMQELYEAGGVRWVYRHFTLDHIHPEARMAAQAAECASEQMKFWQFSDLLFEDQDNIKKLDFLTLANRLNMDIDKFDACLRTGKTLERVNAHILAAKELGVAATPTFFVNGKRFVGLSDIDRLLNANLQNN